MFFTKLWTYFIVNVTCIVNKIAIIQLNRRKIIMKKIFIITLIGLCTISIVTNACWPSFSWFSWLDKSCKTIHGSGTPKAKTITTKGIKNIVISSIGKLSIKQCENEKNCTEQLTITADDNMFDYLEQTISGDTLTLKIKNNTSCSIKTPLEYQMTVRDINKIDSSGSILIDINDITTDKFTLDSTGSSKTNINKIKARLLSIKSSGSSKINISKLDNQEITIVSSGSSRLQLSGTTVNQNIELSGSSQYDTQSLNSTKAKVKGYGAIKMHLNVSSIIQGELSGASSLFYNGQHNPTVNVQTSGSSTINKR